MIPMYRLCLYTVYVDYMDPDVFCPKKADECNYSLTHSKEIGIFIRISLKFVAKCPIATSQHW